MSYVTVTGLNFPNGIKGIVLRNVPNYALTVYHRDGFYTVGYGADIFVSPSITTNFYRAKFNAYVNSTGFLLPVAAGSVTYYWEAWGV